MKENNIIKILETTFLVVLLISFTSAFSVSRDYLENNQLNMTLSQIKNIDFVLQNGGGASEPINVKVRIIDGSEVISLVGEDIYLVNPGDKVHVTFKVSVPEEAKFGNEYIIKIGFSEVSANMQSLSFGTEIEQNFKVKIEKTQEEREKDRKLKNILLIIGICILILLVLIIIVVYIQNKKNLEKKTKNKKTR